MSPAPETIFALSSGRPPAAIAVVRISGPQARRALEVLSGRLPEPRHASLTPLRDPENGEPLDEALALWLPGPRSETGEDMAELHLHGGRAVIAAVLAALGRLEGFRPAEAGEFTRRAFENGRLDLTAVEGLADLIGAETEAQRRQAYRQMKGLLGDKAESWRAEIIQALALVEAGIDFSDEGDVPDDVMRPALDIARKLHDEISAVLAQAGRGERLRDGMVVAIAGPPNAGKSTLLNRIARREAAIVSPYAGTTRDVIEVHLDLGGYPVTLLDTAGVRATDDPVEQEGVRRARQRAAEADLVLWVTDAREAVGDVLGQWPNFSGSVADATGSAAEQTGPVAARRGSLAQASDRAADGAMADTREAREQTGASVTGPLADPPTWVIRNKIDLLPTPSNPAKASKPSLSLASGTASPSPALQSQYNESVFSESAFISLSASTGVGLEALLSHLQARSEEFFGASDGLITRERHRSALVSARAALARISGERRGEELVAEEMRLAARALGRLVGKVDVEDILDAIFWDFCIGK